MDAGPYRVSVALPTAPNLIEGGVVLVKGFEAGSVDRIRAEDGRAILDLVLNPEFAPLHEGAAVTVEWRAVLGERYLAVEDGPADAPAIADGGTVEGAMDEPIEVDRVLSTLDPDTRADFASLVRELETTVAGNEEAVNSTIGTAGPALEELGEVLRALGTDGEAITQLVGHTGNVLDILIERDADVRTIVTELSTAANATARQRQQLDSALQQLPGTLGTAERTLATVPETVELTNPLLEDLRPVTSQLPQFARNLTPVLQELRPAVAELRPTMDSLSTLLQRTPALLDSADAVLPGLDSALTDLTPALTFLRPYTPEALGWMSNWASATANYDTNGHYMRSLIMAGPTSLNANPGVAPPGVVKDPYSPPGALEGQPWTDAYGSGAR
ncbi:MlaD family protein [Pseudonocardia abyssalis]|nr:MlaD family protein [Pseudonocardia abyssalis]